MAGSIIDETPTQGESKRDGQSARPV
jgi:hypothetical protein